MYMVGCKLEVGHLPLTFDGRGAVLADFRFKATPVISYARNCFTAYGSTCISTVSRINLMGARILFLMEESEILRAYHSLD